MDNFDLKKYLIENKTPIQEIDDNVVFSSFLTVGLAVLAFTPLIVKGSEKLGDVIKSNYKEWKKNREVKKITLKLQQDPEIQEFLTLPPDQQKGQWRKLVASKLTDEELNHLRSISRQMVKNKLVENRINEMGTPEQEKIQKVVSQYVNLRKAIDSPNYPDTPHTFAAMKKVENILQQMSRKESYRLSLLRILPTEYQDFLK